MRVCIDIQSAVSQRAGVGRYTQRLVEHLGPCRGDDRLSFFYFDFRRRALPFPAPGADLRVCRWLPGRLMQKAWKTFPWPSFDAFAGDAEVYHFPNFLPAPVRRGRVVVTVHDMSFVRYPEFAERRNLRYLQTGIQKAVDRADAVITDSAFSADEIRLLLRVDPARVFPIHLGLSQAWTRPAPEALARDLAAMGLSRPYLLFVGTLEPRKNIPLLLDVFERLDSFDGDLVVAGMPGWKCEPILERMRTSPQAARIRYLQYVPDGGLPSLYAGARLFVFPSFYEGFGFPPLEAMQCGTPVVTSTGGSLPEVLGDAAHRVEGFEVERWVHEVEGLLADPARQQALVTRGHACVAQYAWEATARQTWAVYRKVSA